MPGARTDSFPDIRNPRIFRYFKTSPAIIRLAMMMYIRYPLSLRNVENLLHKRGIDIMHETVRVWRGRFGQVFAAEIRRSRVQAMRDLRHRRWHLDEAFVKINGMKHYLWHAVGHEGEVLKSFVTKTQNKAAALKFLRKSLRRHGQTEVIVTDRLESCGAALKAVSVIGKRETGHRLNNRAENSHQPFRRRERAMLRFRRNRYVQKFASLHGSIHNYFNQERHLTSRAIYKDRRDAALSTWCGLGAA